MNSLDLSLTRLHTCQFPCKPIQTTIDIHHIQTCACVHVCVCVCVCVRVSLFVCLCVHMLWVFLRGSLWKNSWEGCSRRSTMRFNNPNWLQFRSPSKNHAYKKSLKSKIVWQFDYHTFSSYRRKIVSVYFLCYCLMTIWFWILVIFCKDDLWMKS